MAPLPAYHWATVHGSLAGLALGHCPVRPFQVTSHLTSPICKKCIDSLLLQRVCFLPTLMATFSLSAPIQIGEASISISAFTKNQRNTRTAAMERGAGDSAAVRQGRPGERPVHEEAEEHHRGAEKRRRRPSVGGGPSSSSVAMKTKATAAT
jgi:hypothetical protein